jgi:hypothetical protein
VGGPSFRGPSVVEEGEGWAPDSVPEQRAKTAAARATKGGRAGGQREGHEKRTAEDSR